MILVAIYIAGTIIAITAVVAWAGWNDDSDCLAAIPFAAMWPVTLSAGLVLLFFAGVYRLGRALNPPGDTKGEGR